MKDLLKNTALDHPDYNDIMKALDQFTKVNEDNNKNMDKLITNSRLFELQKLFGDQLKIVDAKREFRSEESIQVFWQYDRRPSIVYFLNDLILITEREVSTKKQEVTYKLLTHIVLNDQSLCKEIEDLDHIRHLFIVNGKNDTVTFIADTYEGKLKLISYINELIQELRLKDNTRQEAL